MQIAHSSQHVSAEQINRFAISKDEYMHGGLGKELTAKKLKEEFLLLKTDMLMEPRISGASLCERNENKYLTIYKRNAAMCSTVYLYKLVRDFILIIDRGARQ